MLLFAGYFVGSYIYSSPVEPLGRRLSNKHFQSVRFYDTLTGLIENITEKDTYNTYNKNKTEQCLKDLKVLKKACIKIKGIDGIDEDLNKLHYFTRSYYDDVLIHRKENNNFKDREELLELYMEISTGFENIIYDYYQEDKNNQREVIAFGKEFWDDEMWYKVLSEMGQSVKESNFRERRKEKLE